MIVKISNITNNVLIFFTILIFLNLIYKYFSKSDINDIIYLKNL